MAERAERALASHRWAWEAIAGKAKGLYMGEHILYIYMHLSVSWLRPPKLPWEERGQGFRV